MTSLFVSFDCDSLSEECGEKSFRDAVAELCDRLSS